MSNYLANLINSSDLYTEPSFFKGTARVLDLFGQLDEYNYKDDPDTEALKRDWAMIGKTFSRLLKIMAEAKQAENREINKRSIQIVEHFVGPLPPPQIIGHYEKIYPGAAKIIFDTASSQTKHRQKLEERVTLSNVTNERLGMWLSFISLIFLSGLGFILIYTGKNVSAGFISFLGIMIIQGANFFFRKHKERKDLNKKKKKVERHKQLDAE